MEGGIKTGVFGQYLVRFISKTVKDTATVAMKSKQELNPVLYPDFRMVQFSMTFDLEWLLTKMSRSRYFERQITGKWYKIKLYLQWQTNM